MICNEAHASSDVAPKVVTIADVTHPEERAGTGTEAIAAQASNELAFALFRELAPPEQTDNVFISPTSLSLALQMAYNGATGVTAQEMAEVLRIAEMSPDDANRAALDLQNSLRNQQEVELLIANSAWLRSGFALDDNFVQMAHDSFDAEVDNFLDSEQGVERINNWASENTKGMIPKVIDMIDPDEVLFLLNAVYFLGDWEHPFDPMLSRPNPFILADGSEQSMTFMFQENRLPYYSNRDYAALALPYGEGRMQMVILLPQKDYSLAELVDDLTIEQWQETLDSLTAERVVVALPRFNVEYEIVLNDVLIELGMPTAFDGAATFDKLVKGRSTMLSLVKHVAVVEVDEEGTEAAAVTVVGSVVTSAPPPSTPFVVDHPFFFAIHDTDTNAILFMGASFEPETLES